MMISAWIKIPYTIFVCILVPIYWQERGPANFLWISDVALLATVPALWMESRLLTSMMAVGVLLPEFAWNLDFFLRLITGHDVIGLNGTGYMFETSYSPLFRFFSLFHVFLPVLLLWMVFRLGYDSRAVYAQTLLVWILLPVCYLATDPERNLNWVFGLGNPPQTWVPGPLYLILLMSAYPLLVLIPTHIVLKSVFSGRRFDDSSSG
jgi:hypothetical protein